MDHPRKERNLFLEELATKSVEEKLAFLEHDGYKHIHWLKKAIQYKDKFSQESMLVNPCVNLDVLFLFNDEFNFDNEEYNAVLASDIIKDIIGYGEELKTEMQALTIFENVYSKKFEFMTSIDHFFSSTDFDYGFCDWITLDLFLKYPIIFKNVIYNIVDMKVDWQTIKDLVFNYNVNLGISDIAKNIMKHFCSHKNFTKEVYLDIYNNYKPILYILDNDNIVANSNFDLDFLKEYKFYINPEAACSNLSIPWSYFDSVKITPDMVRCLSNRADITKEIYEQHKNKLDPFFMSRNYNVSFELLDEMLDHITSDISLHPGLTFDFVKKNLDDPKYEFEEVLSSANVTWEDVEENPELPWDWDELITNWMPRYWKKD